MTIVYRSVKGSNLTATEVDDNFHDLDDRVTTLEVSDPDIVEIDHFVVEGTLLTIVLTNGVEHGPFPLPTAQWRFTGQWLPGITYLTNDIVSNDGSLYFIRVQHISAPTFDPGLFTIEGYVYVNILARADQPYDIGLGFWNDVVPAGEEVILQSVAVRPYTIAESFEGSIAFLKIAPTGTVTLPVVQNLDTVIAYIVFEPGSETDDGGLFGAFESVNSSEGEILVARGDRISVLQATESESDATAAGLSVTIAGVI